MVEAPLLLGLGEGDMVGRRLLVGAVALLALAMTGCTSGAGGADAKGEKQEVAVDPPRVQECRVLEPADIAAPSNDSLVVDCQEPHTAETFLVDEFRGRKARLPWDDPALGAAVYDRCQPRWMRFVGADESLALRTLLGWAWFRPTEEQWDAGARWYRCDVVGGTEESARLPALPVTTKGVLLGRPDDRWLACVDGEEVSGAPWVPCTSPHTWRAVTTIVVGKEKDRYPGDRLVEVITRDFCRESVLFWLDFPLDYEFAYTYFHRAEWERGNRRSICWARTDR
jgi:hypothetical protein